MNSQGPTELSRLFVAGINYKKTDAAVRGLYAINNDQYAQLFERAPHFNIDEFFVLSTCNRTEIYGFASEASSLVNLLCSQADGPAGDFMEMAYIHSGREAVEHLFSVAAGLDSQILGDYEIIGQIKQAVKFSREHKFVGAYLDRIVNGALQSSKEIRTQTELSGGTVSVSFAAVQYIREHVQNIAGKKILLIGTGKIGRNTCKNMVDYLGTKNITLINRTEEKAAELAGELGLTVAPLQELSNQVQESDIIVVATNAADPVIRRSDVVNAGNKLIIDLSVPYNVETEAQFLSNVTLVNVDELSKIKDETLQKRIAEVPKAKAIILKYIDEFVEWHDMRRNVPVLKAVKTKLEELHTCNLYISYSERHETVPSQKDPVRIQKVINGMAVKMREQNQRGCHYIEAINEYLATGTI
jgi:glutamyl-tRNA reductase